MRLFPMKTKPVLQLSLLLAFCLPFSAFGFLKQDSAQYVAQFSDLIADSYAAVDDLSEAPDGLLSACRGQGFQGSTGTVTLSQTQATSLSSADVQTQCGDTNTCVIGENVTLNVDGPLKLHSLVIKDGGTVRWNDQTQSDADVWMCAGYAVVEEGGTWDMSLQDASKNAWIYIMNNGATHDGLRTRAFGSYVDHGGMHHSGDMMAHEEPHLSVIGRELDRTWSLLAEPLTPFSTSIQVMHDPVAMGWQVGDRIAVAPTEPGMDDNAQEFFIASRLSDGTITLDKASNGTSTHRADRHYAGEAGAALRSAEVINLSRNIIITGDDFEEVACDASLSEVAPGFGTSTQGCMCSGDRNSCTVGLHTASAHGGFSEIANVRVEKCGQRGIEGKYCLHFHHMNDCAVDGSESDSKCISRNNAVEFSQQRGLIIHSTHQSLVESNVFYDVRGGNLYIEDGNEMLNTVAYNVAICPRGDNGCTLPGTSNGQADTSLNQSGLYMESPNNLLVGNRMANHFNGMFNNAGNGRGPVNGEVCGGNVPLGLWAGNTFHSSGRFGTYLLNGNFPRQDTGQSIANNGTTNFSDDCAAYDWMGTDLGLSSVILNHFDYGNTFVGQYGAGDIQYKNSVNIDNLNAVYWKETKTFEDGWSAHISDSYYDDGSADLPDAMGAFIIEDTTFRNYGLRANHHCDVGVTGYLCMPQYVLHNVTWIDGRGTWMDFDINNGETNYGGIFTLSPENIAAKASGANFDIFPQAYNSAVGQSFPYLLDLPEENCTRSGDIGLGSRYSDGILCGAQLTPLKIFTRNHGGGNLVLTVFDRTSGTQLAQQSVPHLNITDRKQGYSVPVIAGDQYRYEVSLVSGADIDPSWVIDFGDLAVSNRWGVEHLHLEVQGRTCESPVESNHDRRFYAAGDFPEEMWGRGACTGFDSMPAEVRSEAPDLTQNLDPSYDGWQSRLDSACGTVDCGEHGACSAQYLGSDVPVLTSYQCVCEEGWFGPYCGNEDPNVDPDPLPEPDPEPTPVGSITALQLVDADTNTVMQSLSDNDTLSQDVVGTALNVVAVTDGVIGRIDFAYGASLEFNQSESAAPYALGGDFAGSYNAVPYLQSAGEKRIRARAFSESGLQIDSLELSFTIAEAVTDPEPEPEPDTQPGPGADPAPDVTITIDGRSLLLNSSRYKIKGVAWNPVPVGGSHPNDLDFSGYADIDIPLMQDMGINTVRTYEPILDTVVLDKLHAAGIKVINSAYTWGGNDVSSVDAVVNAVKGHPAILMWSVGNEWNYNGLYFGLDHSTSAERVNAVAQRIKTLDPDTPVATVYGELPSPGLVDQLNHVDVWAINVYRGISFGDLFDRWHAISDKPMFIGEYGADAYNANNNSVGGGVGYDPESQSVAVVALTQEIFDNFVSEDAFGNQRGVIGGTFFEWADEWWKAGDPSRQDTGGVAPGGGPYPDATFNEEYWGIVDIDRNQRCGFYNLKALYASITNNTAFSEVPCGSVNPEPVPEPQPDPEPDAQPETDSSPENSGSGTDSEGSGGGSSGGGGALSLLELMSVLLLVLIFRIYQWRSKSFGRAPGPGSLRSN